MFPVFGFFFQDSQIRVNYPQAMFRFWADPTLIVKLCSVIVVALCVSGVIFLRTSLKIFGDEQIISNEPNRLGVLAAIKAHVMVPHGF